MAKIPTISPETVGAPNAMSSTTAGRVGQSRGTLIGARANQEEFKGATTPLARLLEKTRLEADRGAVDEYETGLMITAAEIKQKWGSKKGRDVAGAQDGAAADFDKAADALDAQFLATGSQKRAGSQRRNGIGTSLVNSIGVYEAKESHRHNVNTKRALMAENVSAYASTGTEEERDVFTGQIEAIAGETQELVGLSAPERDAYLRKAIGEASEGRVEALRASNRFADARGELEGNGASIDPVRRAFLDGRIEKDEIEFTSEALAEKYHKSDLPPDEARLAMANDPAMKPGMLDDANEKFIELERQERWTRDQQDSDVRDALYATPEGRMGRLLLARKLYPEKAVGLSKAGEADLYREDADAKLRRQARAMGSRFHTAAALRERAQNDLANARTSPVAGDVFKTEDITPDFTHSQWSARDKAIGDANLPAASKLLARKLLKQAYDGKNVGASKDSTKSKARKLAKSEIRRIVRLQKPSLTTTATIDGVSGVSLGDPRSIKRHGAEVKAKQNQYNAQVENMAIYNAYEAIEGGRDLTQEDYNKLYQHAQSYMNAKSEGTDLPNWWVHQNIRNADGPPQRIELGSGQIHSKFVEQLGDRIERDWNKDRSIWLSQPKNLTTRDLEELHYAVVSAAANENRKGRSFHLDKWLLKHGISQDAYRRYHVDVVSAAPLVQSPVAETTPEEILAPRPTAASTPVHEFIQREE